VDRELAVVLGMSISYIASLAGMFVAMWAYKKNERLRKLKKEKDEERSHTGKESTLGE
jgi:uncharacterized membrane protein YdjX (TVP38/TMEM64 family)